MKTHNKRKVLTNYAFKIKKYSHDCVPLKVPEHEISGLSDFVTLILEFGPP